MNAFIKSNREILSLLIIGVLVLGGSRLLSPWGCAVIVDKKTDAQAQCIQMAVAIEGFYNQYQKWPVDCADLTADGANNIQHVVFYGGTLTNPWGQPIKFAVDSNLDGKINAVDVNLTTPSAIVSAKIAVWSEIPDEGVEAANSWE